LHRFRWFAIPSPIIRLELLGIETRAMRIGMLVPECHLIQMQSHAWMQTAAMLA
jgi:hypothetical protein